MIIGKTDAALARTGTGEWMTPYDGRAADARWPALLLLEKTVETLGPGMGAEPRRIGTGRPRDWNGRNKLCAWA